MFMCVDPFCGWVNRQKFRYLKGGGLPRVNNYIFKMPLSKGGLPKGGLLDNKRCTYISVTTYSKKKSIYVPATTCSRKNVHIFRRQLTYVQHKKGPFNFLRNVFFALCACVIRRTKQISVLGWFEPETTQKQNCILECASLWRELDILEDVSTLYDGDLFSGMRCRQNIHRCRACRP